jgi:hypothetical protein
MSKKMAEVRRNEISTLLEEWQKGVVDEREVHERAEVLMGQVEDAPNYLEHDPRSIPMEVLVHLDALNYQLITPEDIPVMLAFLSTPLGDESSGWKEWRSYWEKLDLESRRQQLKDNSYYST